MTLVGEVLIDYSARVPDPQAIKADGYVGALRYVSPPRASYFKAKPLTRAEADALKAEGLLIISNWQYGKGGPNTSDWIRGYDGGLADARNAQRIHEEAGGHPQGVLYPSIDAAPTQWEWDNQVRPYLTAWQDTIGKPRLGVYCNPFILQHCLDSGLGQYFWEHGWGGDKDAAPHPAAHIKQFEIDTTHCDGVVVDRNRIYKPLFGQWGTEEGGNVPQQSERERIEKMRGKWVGDPTWLVDVLRLWGLRVDLIGDPDPFKTGHGDFREVVGPMMHHTAGGGVNDWRIVKWGRPGLDGPLSQLVLEKDGSIKFVAVGVAWHAGSGRGSAWAGKFGTDGNWTTVGIEAVSSGVERDGHYDWTPAQLWSYKVMVAAILWFLRKPADWSCGHREYNIVDGKIDPAGIDLPDFRREVDALILGGPEMVTTKPGGGSDQTGPPTPPLELPTEKTGIELCRDANVWLGNKAMIERELPCPDGLGRYCHYERGSIYFHPDIGSIAVPKGGIYEFWSGVGWETSWLGYPIAPYVTHDQGTAQEFQHGTICSQRGDEKGWPVFGGIRDTWLAGGGVDGKYGWPQSREYPHPTVVSVVVQNFTLDKIAWRMTDGPISLEELEAAQPPPPDA